ncbi:FecR domain-containing protein [Candidatus Sumerlaeota bacterium]|nr:FecR domain-containing protein [Candidatus Sumerlaeota bacterium]
MKALRSLMIICSCTLITYQARAQETADADSTAMLKTIEDTSIIPEGYDALIYGALQDVKALPAGAKDWVAVEKPSALKTGSEVLTAQGKTKIRLRGNGQVRLPPDSHVAISTTEQGNVMITLKKGKIWNSMAAEEGRNYVVRTPEIAAGVRGALFVVQTTDDGSRFAVFSGQLKLANREDPQNPITVPAGKQVLVHKNGAVSQAVPVTADEREEWDEWDQWAAEVHEQIGSKFVFGGQAIDNLAKLNAMDQQAVEAMAQETAVNRAAERADVQVRNYAEAFKKLILDIGVQPTEEQGFAALVQNVGQWPNWKGPYINDDPSTLPPVDQWAQPLRYVVLVTPGGTEYYAVVSSGPDRRFSKGKADDLQTMVGKKK